jgi:hypothetical protein
MNSKLNATYARYQAELRRHETAVTEIRAKLEALEEAGATAEIARALVEAAVPEDEPSLTQRVFDVVQSLPEGKAMRRVEIGTTLRAQGYVPKGDNFHITLFKTLMRLKAQGRIGAKMVEGKWTFFPLR